MAYKFTQNCEIDNVKFNKWDVISEKDWIKYFSSVMEVTNDKPAFKVESKNGKAFKTETKESVKSSDLVDSSLTLTVKQLKEEIRKLNPDIDNTLLNQNKAELEKLYAELLASSNETKVLTTDDSDDGLDLKDSDQTTDLQPSWDTLVDPQPTWDDK